MADGLQCRRKLGQAEVAVFVGEQVWDSYFQPDTNSRLVWRLVSQEAYQY